MTKRWRFDLFLAGHFSSLGSLVARTPGIFILVPILITLLMGSGVQQFTYMSDVFYLFVPISAKSKEDSARLQTIFPENLTSHVLGSELRFPQMLSITLEPVEGRTALSRDVWEEAALLTEAVSEISVYSEGSFFTWTDICAKFMGKCLENSFLDLLNSTNIGSDTMDNLNYPVMRDPVKDDVIYPVMAHLGGVTRNEQFVTAAQALKLSFLLDDSNKYKKMAAISWSNALHQFLQNIRLKTAKISCFNPNGMEKEMVVNIQTAFVNNFTFVVFLVASFSIFNCMSTDWVRSKPIMGVIGLLNVILSVVAGFGLSLYLGFPWQAINLVVIFLAIGIGMDGVFLMLSAWSRSELVSRDLVTRMSVTYSDAAVSLTITSLTNILSFFVGAVVPGFPCVQIFCVYASIALFFNYVWTITVFGAFLAIAGHMEHSNRHCLLLTKVKSKSMSEKSSWFYRLLLTGGISQADPDNVRDNKDEKMMLFFKNTVTPILNWNPTKILILVTFSFYLAVSVLGIYKLQEGLQLQNMVMDSSCFSIYLKAEDKYFRDNAYRIQVVIPEKLDYHNHTVQNQVLDLLAMLEDSEYITNNTEFRQSWLHEFLKVAEENFLLFNITTKEQFNANLKFFMAEAKETPLYNDVKFNTAGTEVEASRFFLQTEWIENAKKEKEMLIDLRQMVLDYPFEVLLFSPHFFFFDQYAEVFDNTVQCVILCCLSMAAVILIFIPNKLCVIWVILTVFSVTVGVLGLMSFWGIRLDVISMIVLIMGIGFSVDFSAHISYHYLSAEKDLTPGVRLAHCLHALGPPILQGATTTILCSLPLMRHPSYAIQTFSKMIFLVVFFGLVHSLLLLPVLLTLFGPGSCGDSKDKSKSVILSPSTTSLSDTFIYKNGQENCLRKRAFTGETKRLFEQENVIKRTFAETEIKTGEESRGAPFANLHLSFFQPSESDVSELNIITKEDMEEGDISFRPSRAHSDSSYYSYQKRHLRRHMKQVPTRHDRLGTRNDMKEKYPEMTFPDKLENIKQDLKRSVLNNNNYKFFFQEKEGVDNAAFDDSEGINTPVNSSVLSTFKPGQVEQHLLRSSKGLKIVCIDDHPTDVLHSDNASSDSFDDVELDEPENVKTDNRTQT